MISHIILAALDKLFIILWTGTTELGMSEFVQYLFAHVWYNTIILFYLFILLFHLISYETFTKYFHKHVQHKYKEWYNI